MEDVLQLETLLKMTLEPKFSQKHIIFINPTVHGTKLVAINKNLFPHDSFAEWFRIDNASMRDDKQFSIAYSHFDSDRKFWIHNSSNT